MGKYENKIAIESCIKTIHKQKCTEHKAQSMIDELEMAYDKAKAWDNYIAEVRERVRFTENTEDDIENETQKVIDYYMEDE